MRPLGLFLLRGSTFPRGLKTQRALGSDTPLQNREGVWFVSARPDVGFGASTGVLETGVPSASTSATLSVPQIGVSLHGSRPWCHHTQRRTPRRFPSSVWLARGPEIVEISNRTRLVRQLGRGPLEQKNNNIGLSFERTQNGKQSITEARG